MTEGLLGEGKGVKPRIEIVKNEAEEVERVLEILHGECNFQTAIFLSGGKTTKLPYEALAREGKLSIGAAAMVDERYSKDFTHSNETMIRKTGLVDYFDSAEPKPIQFYPILHPGMNELVRGYRFKPRIGSKYNLSREKTSEAYDKTVGWLFERFLKRVAILGLGVDGHIAGIAPNRSDFKDPIFDPNYRTGLLVSSFADPKPMSSEGSSAPPNGFGERITLTPYALSRMSLILLLVLGESKRDALEKIFKKGNLEDVPGRILTTGDIAQNTIVITDQVID